MVGEPPSWHPVPSQGKCGMGAIPLVGYEGPPKKYNNNFEAPGFHFGQFLANLAFCLILLRNAFAAEYGIFPGFTEK